jgi:hypothetical protein
MAHDEAPIFAAGELSESTYADWMKNNSKRK